MLVYLTAVAAMAFYALNIPLNLAFSIDVGDQNRLEIGVGPFGAVGVWKRTIRFNVEEILALLRQRDERPKKKINWRKIVLLFYKRAVVRDARFSLRLGTGDAARTALLCGAAQTAAWTLRQVRLHGMRISIVPVYGCPMIKLRIEGILSLRAGHIISAMALHGIDTIKGRIHHGKSSD